MPLTSLHHFLSEDDLIWLQGFQHLDLSDEQAKALIFLREVGAIDNAAYRNLNHIDTLTASKQLGQLKDWGLVRSKGSGKATYYEPTERLLRMEVSSTSQVAGDAPGAPVNTQGSSADTQGLDSNTQGFDTDTQGVPHEIQALVDNLGPRPREQRLREVLLLLCEWQPLSPSELIILLPLKDASHLVRKHLTPMRQCDWLEYTIPEMPPHPGQKYRTTKAGRSQLVTWRSQGGWDL